MGVRGSRMVSQQATPALTTPNNVYDGAPGTNQGTYATWSRPAASAAGDWYVGFDLSGLPDNAILNKVTARMRHYGVTSTRFNAPTIAPAIYPNDLLAAQTLPAMSATARLDEVIWDIVSAKPSDLKDPNFAVHIQVRRTSAGGNHTWYLDYVDLEIDYLAATTKVWDGSAWVPGTPKGWDGSAWVPLKTWDGGAWVTM